MQNNEPTASTQAARKRAESAYLASAKVTHVALAARRQVKS